MTESVGMKIYVRSDGVGKTKVSLDQLTKSAENLEKRTDRLRESNGSFSRSNNSVNASLKKTTQEAKSAMLSFRFSASPLKNLIIQPA